jgi:hypothetical protein
VADADEQTFQIVIAGFLDFLTLDPYEVDDELLLFDKLINVEAQRSDILRQLLGVFLERHDTPGSPAKAPRTRNSMASNVLPAPALPHTRVGRPRGRPPPVISSRPRMPLGDLGRLRLVPSAVLAAFSTKPFRL